MRISINPLEQLVKRAERRINFQKVVSAQDLAHDRKRQLAQAVLAGAAPSPEFQQAAVIEGVSVETLAKTIVSKPDVMMEAENARRELIVRVRSAKTPEEIEQVLDEEGIWPHHEDKKPLLVP
ncbi:hypothetical protein IVB12_16085 [Bradyrhizobium sp. 179]|uniref:hypothetical protein n=1 Tax=Bradyrhizobium sp. 179 TaxID=2782648 RepID=UPI001FFBC930|nr:hypothetical protein [Bradyrhizobium sp. 179]MCK1543437.1 hypothetical protein [Bradyrhizobium sp. 179]